MEFLQQLNEWHDSIAVKALNKPPQKRVFLEESCASGGWVRDKDGDKVFVGYREDTCFACFGRYGFEPWGPEKAFERCTNCHAVQHFVAVCENNACGKLMRTTALGEDPEVLMHARIFCSEACEMGLNVDAETITIDLSTKRIAPACDVWIPPNLEMLGEIHEEQLGFHAFCKERGLLGHIPRGEYHPRECEDGSFICLVHKDDRVLTRLSKAQYSKPLRNRVAVHVSGDRFDGADLHEMASADDYSMLGCSAGKRPAPAAMKSLGPAAKKMKC